MQVVATGQTPNSAILSSLSPQSITSNPPGFISVKRTLQLTDPSFPNVFALGDVAHTTHHKAARPAHRQAEVVANNIAKLAEGGEGVTLEEYPDLPAGIHMSLGMVSVFSSPLLSGVLRRGGRRADGHIWV